MIKTNNGNPTLSFTEFKSGVEKVLLELGHPYKYEDGSMAMSSLIRAYADIRSRGYFTKMHNAYEWGYKQTLRRYPPESYERWAVLYIPYGYDAGPGDFVPQDMPYVHLAVDLEDHEAVISDVLERSLYYFLESRQKEQEQKDEEDN